MTRPPLALRVVSLAALALSVLLAGTSLAAADDGVRIRVERIDTLQYPTMRIVAAVIDGTGHPVRGLNASDLILKEDGIPVPARVDLASDAAPVSLAFVLDASGSMAGGPLQEAINATISLTQRLGPRDQAALITFRDGVDVGQALSGDKGAVTAAARRIVPDRTPLASWRAFDDALTAAGDQLLKAPAGSRGAIVLVTDGFDPSSTPAQRTSAIAQSRASLYPNYTVAVGAQLDRATFQGIAEASGGQSFFAPSSAQLTSAYASLSEQILTQYSIAYFSTILGKPGEGRQVRLQVMRAGTVIAETTVGYSVPVSSGLVPATPKATAAPAVAPPAAPAAEPQLPADRGIPTSLNAGAALGALPPGLAKDPAVTVAVLGAAAVFALFLFLINGVIGSGTRVRMRLRGFVPAATNGEADGAQPFRVRVIRAILNGAGKRLAQITPNAMTSSTAAALEQAGHPLGLTADDFIGLRGTSSAGATLLLLIVTWALRMPPEVVAIAALLGVMLGYAVPGMVLRRLVQRRKKDIIRTLPSTVDMITLSVEAGLTFDGAIAQVVSRRHNALGDEFRRLLLEFQMGRPRKDAQRELARRCGVPEIGRLMNVVMQADALGAPLAKALADLSLELRTKRRQKAEEIARTAPIKMLFPMVGLIFPALFVVIIGPAVPRVMSLFTSIH
jgi:tight adherence protein C